MSCRRHLQFFSPCSQLRSVVASGSPVELQDSPGQACCCSCHLIYNIFPGSGEFGGLGASAWQAKCPFSRWGPESAGSRNAWGGTRRPPRENKCLVLKIWKDEKQRRGLKTQNPFVPGSAQGSDNAKLSKAAGSLILGALNLDQLPAQSPCTSRLNLTPGIFVKHPQGILSEMKPVILEVPTRWETRGNLDGSSIHYQTCCPYWTLKSGLVILTALTHFTYGGTEAERIRYLPTVWGSGQTRIWIQGPLTSKHLLFSNGKIEAQREVGTCLPFSSGTCLYLQLLVISWLGQERVKLAVKP